MICKTNGVGSSNDPDWRVKGCVLGKHRESLTNEEGYKVRRHYRSGSKVGTDAIVGNSEKLSVILNNKTINWIMLKPLLDRNYQRNK